VKTPDCSCQMGNWNATLFLHRLRRQQSLSAAFPLPVHRSGRTKTV
jgi:hypothetical protein